MEKYLLLLIVLFTGILGQILLKIEANQLVPLLPEIDSLGKFLLVVFSFLKNFKILLVLFLYGLGFLTWIFILTKFELSYVFPMLVIIYPLVMFFSWIFLKEDITTLRVLGTLIIVIGIILVAKS
ncbi:MAG: Multidrug resistance protein, SMR family [Parcubacteria group bacterium GW2011_GWB1_41_4]|nr:MAG: Multidrug resistance protein, SMR family [Parcubacteria group bacterium GW2011_GWB1_41_4]